MSKPLLSIIIPTRNEQGSLPGLLGDLAAQRDLELEVIVSDGESTDRTVALAREIFAAGTVRGVVVSGPPGRGRQLNRAVARAHGEWLLFLHADSRLTGPRQLALALERLSAARADSGDQLVAGRFPLSFLLDPEQRSLVYYFYEVKARLGRPGCIHGDQGFLLRADDLQRLGPFREDLPVMEDTWLAEKVRAGGRWLLLPGTLCTSARRFQVEGLYERQLLNALLMNFLFIGWTEYIHEAAGAYRAQPDAQHLKLLPFFELVRRLLRSLPPRRRRELWMATGRYVRGQAWQYALLLDCRRNFQRKLPPGEGAFSSLARFDRWFDALTDNRAGRLLAALLVRAWFALTIRRLS